MSAYDLHLPFLAAIRVGSRVAIEIYEDDPENAVIVDLETGVRWGTWSTWGASFEKKPKLARRSELVVRDCWVMSQGFKIRTRLLVEDLPAPEGPYR
jgi:hypothetical protein